MGVSDGVTVTVVVTDIEGDRVSVALRVVLTVVLGETEAERVVEGERVAETLGLELIEADVEGDTVAKMDVLAVSLGVTDGVSDSDGVIVAETE